MLGACGESAAPQATDADFAICGEVSPEPARVTDTDGETIAEATREPELLPLDTLLPQSYDPYVGWREERDHSR